jgi:ABC-2 type transport system ATP-binding protein
MSEIIAVRTNDLSKTFVRGKNRVQAVKSLNLEISAGQVYGFLGPNGAGKTTTIRMLMDLIRPTHGTAEIFGRSVRRDRGVLKRVGAMIESPGFYDYLSGRNNLKVLAQTADMSDLAPVDQVLEQVDLQDQADRRVSEYSTGMKQRLGIASALLSDPDLIILDEPTNGLDPVGIQEMRGFIRRLADEHSKTVLLSSHMLHEVEQVCDRVAILSQGECIREGSVAKLLAAQADALRFQVTPVETAIEVLSARWPVSLEEGWLNLAAPASASAEAVKLLVQNEIEVHQVLVRRQTLEDYFLEATSSQESS